MQFHTGPHESQSIDHTAARGEAECGPAASSALSLLALRRKNTGGVQPRNNKRNIKRVFSLNGRFNSDVGSSRDILITGLSTSAYVN